MYVAILEGPTPSEAQPILVSGDPDLLNLVRLGIVHRLKGAPARRPATPRKTRREVGR